MSLQNFSNDEYDEYVYSEETYLLPNEESSWSLSKEPSDEQLSTLDEDSLLLDKELSPIIDSKPASNEESLSLPKGSTGHLQTVHRLNQTGPLLPLSSEKEVVQLQPVRLDPLQPTLVELINPITKLQKDLAKNKERDIRNHAKTLEKLLLNDDDLLGIQELVELLGLFAHVTTIVGGDHYSTLSIMLPLVKILQEHLFQKEDTLTHPIICKVRNEIELSFGEHWEEPGPEGYVAAMLDSRFKDISFEPAKFESTKENLKCRMKEDIKNNNYSLSNTNLSTSLL
ncbi:4858_t:CDS:2, partial [Gigaspora rosea]